MTQLEIPPDHQSITVDWLKKALHGSVAVQKAEIQSFEMNVLSAGQVGKIARFSLHYARPAEGAPSTIMVKLSNPDPAIRAHMDKISMYEKEVRFYQEVAPLLDLPLAHCYYADYDDATGHSVLLLEDLSALNAIDRVNGCDTHHAELVIRLLAKLHAQWWDNPRLQSSGYFTPFDHMASYSQERYQEWWPVFLNKLDTYMPDLTLSDSFRRLGQRYGSFLVETYMKLSQPPVTILHRDLGVDNMLFGAKETDPPLILLDWQLLGHGRGVSDVTYFMAFALPVAARQQEEGRLLKMYHGLLEQHGVSGYTFEQCWHDYRLAVFRNLSVAVNVISISEPSNPYLQATARALIPRLMAFCEDHRVDLLLR